MANAAQKGENKTIGGNIMKNKKNKFPFMKLPFVLFVLITVIPTVLCSSQSLKEIYATGSIRFVEEMRIDESALPEGEFFGSITDIAVDEQGNVYLCDCNNFCIEGHDGETSITRLSIRKNNFKSLRPH